MMLFHTMNRFKDFQIDTEQPESSDPKTRRYTLYSYGQPLQIIKIEKTSVGGTVYCINVITCDEILL